jgi:hypothetical protein
MSMMFKTLEEGEKDKDIKLISQSQSLDYTFSFIAKDFIARLLQKLKIENYWLSREFSRIRE